MEAAVRRDAFNRVDVLEGHDVDHYRPPAGDTINVFVDDGRPWCATFLCPCGCGDLVMVPLNVGNAPKWSTDISVEGKVTLSPSVHRTVGCGSHFFIQSNEVVWC